MVEKDRHTKNKKFLDFESAKLFVRTLNIKGQKEWVKFCKSEDRPKNIPIHPEREYKNTGWISLGDWLGTGTIASKNLVFLTYEESKTFIKNLNIKSVKEFKKYIKSGNIPDNIPSNPNSTYKNRGWISWNDWFGKSETIEFVSFEDAKIFVQSLNINSVKEWREYSKTSKKPENIPASPHKTYKNNGWISWGDWFGTSTIAHKYKEFISFEEAKLFVHILGLKSNDEWKEYSKSGLKPENIPAVPDKYYKDKGWISWGDWLGTNSITSHKAEFLSFEIAREIVRKEKIINFAEWTLYRKSKNKPHNIPSSPNEIYKGKGWVSWGDWFGNNKISNKQKNKSFVSYEEAEKFAKQFSFKSSQEWIRYFKKHEIPYNIPMYPNEVYKNKGWSSWGVFLGNGRIADQLKKNIFLPFNETKKFIQNLGLKSFSEWREYVNSGMKPDYIPANPDKYYGYGYK